LDFDVIEVDDAIIRFCPCWRTDPPGTAGCLAFLPNCKRLGPCTQCAGETCSLALLRAKLKGAIMINGTVKFYNATKGFGFITPDSGGKDAFVHVSAIERAGLSTLADGQKVSYDLETGRDGRESAANLALV